MKRVQFGTTDEPDDRLVQEVVEGKKTASVDLAHRYHVPNGVFDDGGYEVGDVVEVYDSRGVVRGLIRITEVYGTALGTVPERLWKAEVCESADHFRAAHENCWPDDIVTDDSPLTAFHFELMAAIRKEERDDEAAVRAVNERAFGQRDEADIVDRLRVSCRDLVSLVAVREESAVGHILFSPASIEGRGGLTEGMALAPMAVIPECQRQGVGSALVRAGLAVLRLRSCPFVVVLGHPEYYPRFGFVPASRRAVRCSWEGVPDEVFMILVLEESAMIGVAGVARYRDEFTRAV
jgi:putative acetyltransferase